MSKNLGGVTPPRMMQSRVHKISATDLLRRVGNFLKYLVTMDVYFFMTWLILIVLALLFAVEFVMYVIVKLLVRAVENVATPAAVRRIKKEMYFTSSLVTYNELALKLDQMTGRQDWKESVESAEYDWSVLEQKGAELRGCRANQDVGTSVDLLRSCVELQFFKHTAGALDEGMYSRTYLGTKSVIESFIEEVQKSIDFVAENYQQVVPLHTPEHKGTSASAEYFVTSQTSILDTPNSSWTPKVGGANVGSAVKARQAEKLQMAVNQIRFQWGYTALVLSGGAALGWHHFGVAETLIKQQLLPRIICGTSAGSAVAAWLCTRDQKQLLSELRPQFLVKCFSVFVPASWIERGFNFFRKGYACDIDFWQRNTYAFFGSETFLEAFIKTGRILNITLTRADREEFQILNYRTAPNVVIGSAVIASCSCPGLGPTFHLLDKASDGQLINSETLSGQYFHDGSIKGDIPLSQIKEMWGVKFAIVSQVNPHIFPFSGLRAHGEAGTPNAWKGEMGKVGWRGGFILSFAEVFLKEHLRFLLRLVVVLRIAPNFGGVNFGNLIQSYSGDVTVHPSRLHWNHRKFSADPTIEEAEWYLQKGRNMTFVKWSFLRNRLLTDQKLNSLYEVALGLPPLPP